MVFTGTKFEKDHDIQKESKRLRKIRTAEAKERARCWAENRRLSRIPLVVAHEVSSSLQNVSSERTEVSTSSSQGLANSERIVRQLELKRQELLKEAAELQSAIQVIRRTFEK